MLRDRPAPVGLRFSPPSWACWRGGRLGTAGKSGPALGPLPPRPGCGVGPRQAEVPTTWLLHPTRSKPRRCLPAGGGGADSSCLGQDPSSGPGQLHRRPPLTSLCHLDSCQWPCSPALPCHGGRDLGINHCRPCLSQAETGPPRSAGIHPPCAKDLGRTYSQMSSHFILMSVPFS